MDENQKQKESPKSNWPLLFLTLIVGVLVAGVAYLVWQQQMAQNVSTSPNLLLLQKQISDQQEMLNSQKNAIAQLEKKSTERSQDIDLSQVRHLINLANLNLIAGRDLEGAQTLLKLALEKMALQNNPILLPLQKAVESDLGRLSAMPAFNIESVILELDNINQRIQSTSIMPNLAFKPTTSAPVAAKPDEKWYTRVLNSLSGLKELFIIRHVDQNVAPLISPQDERFLKENIQTKMLQAEWAVINQKPLIYQRSLKEVSSWVKQYFHDPKNVQPIMDSLARLQGLNVKLNYPALENSLRTLAALAQNPAPLEKKIPVTPEPPKIPNKNAVPEKAPEASGVAI